MSNIHIKAAAELTNPHAFKIGKLYRASRRITLAGAMKRNIAWRESGVVELLANDPVLVVDIDRLDGCWAVVLASDCYAWLHINDCKPL